MLLVEGYSETGLFRYLSNQVFRIRNFENAEAVRVSFFSKCSKFNLDFKIGTTKKGKFLVSDIIAS